MMSGVRAPATRLGAEGKPDPTQSEPYAIEAHYFTESRLLQVPYRTVTAYRRYWIW